MRGPLTIITIITCFLLLEPAVLADPPDGAPLATRTQATQLTTRAIATAQAGDCPAAIRLGLEVRDLDRAYYDQTFSRDPAISACTGARSSPDLPLAAAERRALVFGGGLALSKQGVAQGELRLGWMFHPQLSVFAAIAGGVVSEGGGYKLQELGVRAGSGRGFVDLRAGRLSVPSGCDFDDLCVTRNHFAWSAGLGLELVHRRHFGLELRGDILSTRIDSLFFAGLGFSLYL